MTLERLLKDSDEVTRRGFVSAAARAFLGLSAMPYMARAAAAEAAMKAMASDPRAATARNVIYLFMSGGMSHVDTLDVKPGTPSQGRTEAIDSNVDGIQLSSHFAGLAKHMDKVALINSMWSNQGAHRPGRYFMHTSYLERGTIQHPGIGSWVARLAGKVNPNIPGHVAIGAGSDHVGSGFLESEFGPLPIGDPAAGLQNSARADGVSESDFDRRMKRLARVNEEFAERHGNKKVRAYDDMYREAVKLMGSSDLAAFDINLEPESLRAAYGEDSFGQGCLLARRLIEHGVRFVEVVNGGWDTHNDNFDTMDEKVPTIDRALSTLLADLEVRGMLEETLVVLTTEFGRTPSIREGREGRDHHPQAFSSLFAGGGIRGGRRWGLTDELGQEIAENKVTVPDFNATIAYALGLPLEKELTSPSGRPFTVADKGRPITELFA